MARRRRTLIVGDVHGCRQELEALLAAVTFVPHADRLVFVGDVLARGPDPRGTLALARRLEATIVRGNHEQKLLAGRAGEVKLGSDHQRVADALSGEDWRTVQATPLWLKLPQHNLVVVHAGVIPGKDVESTPAEALMRMRTVDRHGRWSDDRDTGTLWGAVYGGPPHVVFGHNARDEVQLHPWATGIDTGCVYGRRLTGMLLHENEQVPRGEAAKAKLVSVASKQ